MRQPRPPARSASPSLASAPVLALAPPDSAAICQTASERELREKEHATDQALLPQMSQRGAVLIGVAAVGVLSGLCVEGEEQRQGKERCPPIVWFFCRLFR
jgi:hypothetical protein